MIKLLVVEDDEDIRDLISLAFDLYHGEVDVSQASTGRQGLDLVNEVLPDLVILDLGLPDMDGLEVCRGIRHLTRAPILVLTARHRDENLEQRLQTEADYYLEKPFEARALVTRVASILGESGPPLSTQGLPCSRPTTTY